MNEHPGVGKSYLYINLVVLSPMYEGKIGVISINNSNSTVMNTSQFYPL